MSHLKHYLRPGAFSGSSFETIGGRGDASDVANHFTPADLVAVTTLGVRVSGWGAIELLEANAQRFSNLLGAVPHGPLHEAEVADLEPLWNLQDELTNVVSVGHVTRSKLLARKRPHLAPIRDQHVLTALVGQDGGNFTLPLRDALQTEGIVDHLQELRAEVDGAQQLSILRVLDIIVWMETYGASSVAR
ncbi:MAG: DUF6308 family protein [Nitriliruptoraceae bacterium]